MKIKDVKPDKLLKCDECARLTDLKLVQIGKFFEVYLCPGCRVVLANLLTA